MLESCEGKCGQCQFPKDYPAIAKVARNLRSSDHQECLILWQELEDGKGIPPSMRNGSDGVTGE